MQSDISLVFFFPPPHPSTNCQEKAVLRLELEKTPSFFFFLKVGEGGSYAVIHQTVLTILF